MPLDPMGSQPELPPTALMLAEVVPSHGCLALAGGRGCPLWSHLQHHTMYTSTAAVQWQLYRAPSPRPRGKQHARPAH